MKVQRQLTLILSGQETLNLISLLKVAYDKSLDSEPIKSECESFIKQIDPTREFI